MNTATIILIIIGAVALFFIWKYVKPYILKYDTTLFLTGGLGSGKTLTAVKTSIVLIRKAIFKYKWQKRLNKIANFFRRLFKKKEIKFDKAQPRIFSNLPIKYKPHWYSKNSQRIMSCIIKKEQLLLFENIPEGSIVLLDEFPQIINQYNWDIEIVQNNFHEFATYFRHYIQGHLILTAQSTSEIVAQLRRKANIATWCFNFKKHLFGLFYTMNCCDIMLSDDVSTTTTGQVEDNTKKLWGFFPPKDTYDTKCYSERYKNILHKMVRWERYPDTTLKTNKIIRVNDYVSPLDDTTTQEQKYKMLDKLKDKK